MRQSDIKVGDVLRVRQWEDMAAEFGVNSYGNIGPNYEEDGQTSIEVFYKEMRDLCGKTFTVKTIRRYNRFINDHEAEEPEFGGRSFEAWMLEPIAQDEEIEPEEPDTLIGFLLL